MSIISIYITFPTESAARKITRLLIQKRLVACSNIFPIESAYWWKEQIENEKEWVGIVKTLANQWENVQAAVEAVHPYDVPCLIRYDISANASYEKWIADQVMDSE